MTLASWERSRAAGLHPDGRNVPVPLEDVAYRERLGARADIVDLFQHFTRRFAGALERLGACSFVCDEEGYLLSRIGPAETLRRFDHVSIREGASCSEAVLGTNAPGLALVTREPVMVTADEHYSRLYHTAFCVASPILDDDRTPIGCIDITKFFDRNDVSAQVRKDLLQLVISLTDAIRSELSLRRLGRLAPEAAAMPRLQATAAPLDASRATFAHVVGRSPRLAEVVRLARSYSLKDANVLIQGETGTGKELLARAIHNEGPRAAGHFVAVNCAAIPVELAESELFGYERGAFTGARAEGQLGKFELAHEGTLFLDEVDSMPLSVQAKILRAVETKRVSRINGKREIAVDVRIVAAGNRSLGEEVLAGRFRKDLFYRLNVLRLTIPPLRELDDDIPALLDAFLAAFAAELGTGVKVLTDDARARLVGYDWPGNVRELRNCVEYLYNTVDGEVVALQHLPPEIAESGPRAGAVAPLLHAVPASTSLELDAVARQHIVETMSRLGGSAVEAARALGISRSSIYRKLKKHGIR
ncbi:MAG TPA: sigma 54-interacting transcriptional regulator [Anaeromyxobacteraceae bacterium]|nr:sigma 54-interacting transcriptional regulator [Anaeromyxobacteraceae bacterium]